MTAIKLARVSRDLWPEADRFAERCARDHLLILCRHREALVSERGAAWVLARARWSLALDGCYQRAEELGVLPDALPILREWREAVDRMAESLVADLAGGMGLADWSSELGQWVVPGEGDRTGETEAEIEARIEAFGTGIGGLWSNNGDLDGARMSALVTRGAAEAEILRKLSGALDRAADRIERLRRHRE